MMNRKLIAAALALAIALSFGLPAAADAPAVDCKAYMLVDARTGAVLAEKNPDDSLVPASLTKLMTMYLILERVAGGELSWDESFEISRYANTISRQPSLSAFVLPEGKEYTVLELFYMSALNSSNAAAIALAEGLSGSEGAFVGLMNAKAAQFGCTDVSFVNSSGLNNSDLFGNHAPGTAANQDTKLSARSMAMIAFRLVNDYPEYLEFSALPRYVVREGQPDEITVNSTNALLPGRTYEMRGARGLKTGSTANAGKCFVGYADRGTAKMLSVVLGAPTTEERFRGSVRLMEYGFALVTAASGGSVGVGDGSEAGADAGALGFLFPDQLSLYSMRAGANPLAVGDTGFGVMRNGKMDVLALNGRLFTVSARGKAMPLDDGASVGTAAMTFFEREQAFTVEGAGSLKEIEDALAASIDVAGSSYCVKIEGDFRPTLYSTLSQKGYAPTSPVQGGGEGGVIIGFWNHGAANAALDEGFTFYYINEDRSAGGLLDEAVFEGVEVSVDRMDSLEAAYGAGHSFRLG